MICVPGLRWRGAALALSVLLFAAGCTSTDPAEDPEVIARCEERAAVPVDEIQTFVDGFADVTLEDLTDDEVPGLRGLEDLVATARDEAAAADCDADAFDTMLAAEVSRLEGSGPVGRELAAALRGDDPASAKPPEELTVDPSEDLAAVVAGIGPGSVITLGPGIYDLVEMIVIDRSLTLTGAGADQTTIRSSSSGAAILIRADGGLDVSDLAIEHVGDEPASVVAVSGGTLSMVGARVEGAIRDPESGTDGHGLALVPSQTVEGAGPSMTGTVEVRSSIFTLNEQTGIAVVGTMTPGIADSQATGNGLCGICFFDTSGGVAKGNTVEDNEVGIGVAGSASPALTGNSVRGNSTTGLLIEDEAAPEVVDNLIEANGQVGLSASGKAVIHVEGNRILDNPQGVAVAGDVEGTVERNVFDGNEVAVLVAGDAAPVLTSNEIENSGTGAIIFGDRAGGTVRTNTLAENAIGIQSGDDSAPSIEENVVDSVEGIALLFVARSSAVAVANVLTGHDVGIQARGFSSPRIEGGSIRGAGTTGIVFAERATGSVDGVAIQGTEIGVLVGGEASPAIAGNTIEGPSAAGIVYGGMATGLASKNRVSDSGSVGIQVGATASPDLDTNTLDNSADVGLLYLDDAAGTATENVVSGGQLGIQVSGRAAPVIDGNTLSGMSEAAMVYADEASGTATGNSCDRVVGIVLLAGTTPTLDDNDCPVRRVS